MADYYLQIARRIGAFEDRGVGSPPVTGRKKGNKSHEELVREQLYEKIGVDLTAVEGVSIQAFLSEVGTDVESLPPRNTSPPWMGLCPDNRITGGRIHAAHARKVQNRLANAHRLSAIHRWRTHKKTLSSPTGRTTRLRLAPGPRGSFIRVE